MSQFSYRGSPNLQCPVSVSAALVSSSPSPASVPILSVSAAAAAAAVAAATSASVTSVNQQLTSPISSTRMAVTSAIVRPPGSPTTSVSPSQPPTAGSGGGGGGGGGGGPTQSGRCCDTGRPLFNDPITGQTICSCQYDLLGNYQRLGGMAPAALSMYSAPYAAAAAAAEGMAAYFPTLGAEQTPFYTTGGGGLDLKENLGAGAAAAWPYPSVYHPYDAAFASYPFNGYGMDLNGARRKNATRETTSTLKAWLNEHKKNPYPTKGEKIMLAIITKMTLTQVSTWFANARRRLKKENKMTWEPRNRVEDEDNNNDDDDSGRKSVDDKDRLDSKDSGTGSSEDGERPTHRLDLLHGSSTSGNIQNRPESEWSESRADSGPDSPECLFDQREPRHPLQLQHPAYLGSHGRILRHPSPDNTSPSGVGSGTSHLPPSTSASSTGSGGVGVGPIKPRIWSLADMASKDGEQQQQQHQHQQQQHHQHNNNNTNSSITNLSSPYGSGNGGGKIVSPLASRLPPHHPLHPAMHTGGQFVRPHPDFYRNFYGASHLGTNDMALLESYSRTLGSFGGVLPPTSNHPSLLTNSSSATSSNIKNFTINGSVNTGQVLLTASSGVSPSSSSTASSIGSEQRQSPHPGVSHPPTELKSPGRV